MRILIIELNHHGHRLRYVRQLIDALVGLPIELTLALHVSAKGSPQWVEFLEPVADNFALSWSDTANFNRESVVEIILQNKPDHVYLPCADDWLWHFSKRFSGLRELRNVEIEGLCLFTPFPYLERGVVSCAKSFLKMLFCVMFSGIRPLHLLDSNAYRYMSWIKPFYRGNWMPDATEQFKQIGREASRLRMGLPQHGFIIVLPGVIDVRKGVDLILEALDRALVELDADVHLVLAGCHAPDIKKLIEDRYASLSRSGRLIQFDRFLSKAEFQAVLESADVVAVPYRHHYGSASVVLAAASLGIPVLGSQCGWIGRTLKRHKIGFKVDTASMDDFVATLIDIKKKCKADVACGFSDEVIEIYSLDNWNETWTRRVKMKLSRQLDESADDRL